MIARFFLLVNRGIDFLGHLLYNIFMTKDYEAIQKQADELERLARRMRREEMQRLKDKGLTLEEIGARYTPKLSRERVRQILKGDD